MGAIKTYIFMDLETSGLPSRDHSPTKITEIAFVAASREHIINSLKGDTSTKENNVEENLLPRVLNKINFTVYPCKLIEPLASAISGLTNENLEHQRPFDETLFKMMVHFMERLEKPICLVAHNGNKFDFPILQSELSKIGKAFSNDLLCADTLPGFREVLTNQQNFEHSASYQEDILSGIKPLNSYGKSSTLSKYEWSNEDYEKEMVQATEIAEQFTINRNSFNVEELESKIKLEMERIRNCNEHTPNRKNGKSTSDQSTKEIGARRRILTDKQQPKRKYNMKSLYENLTGKELVDAHRAEADALALIECVTAVGRPIVEWMDKNHIQFRSIKKMW